jgi:hypothetical protein
VVSPSGFIYTAGNSITTLDDELSNYDLLQISLYGYCILFVGLAGESIWTYSGWSEGNHKISQEFELLNANIYA